MEVGGEIGQHSVTTGLQTTVSYSSVGILNGIIVFQIYLGWECLLGSLGGRAGGVAALTMLLQGWVQAEKTRSCVTLLTAGKYDIHIYIHVYIYIYVYFVILYCLQL